MAVIEEEEENVIAGLVFAFRCFRRNVAEGRREGRLGVELFRRVKPVVDVCSTDSSCEESLRSPQHRKVKERTFEEENEVDDRATADFTCLSRSSRNGPTVASKISDDDDDRVIEMTGGGGLLVTLVIDFYVNDGNESDEESGVGIHTRAMLLIVDELHPYTRMGAFLSLCLCLCLCLPLSQSRLRLPATDDDARNGEQRRCS